MFQNTGDVKRYNTVDDDNFSQVSLSSICDMSITKPTTLCWTLV